MRERPAALYFRHGHAPLPLTLRRPRDQLTRDATAVSFSRQWWRWPAILLEIAVAVYLARRVDRQQHHVVLVVAHGGLALGGEQAHHGARELLHPHLRAQRGVRRGGLAAIVDVDEAAVAQRRQGVGHPSPARQREQRLATWFDATEQYALQLHELDRNDYLAMKRNEFRRMQGGI